MISLITSGVVIAILIIFKGKITRYILSDKEDDSDLNK